jgi:hypothetical protein
MIIQPCLLVESLAESPKFRQLHGKRHPLSAIIALAYSTMLCGYRGYTRSPPGGVTSRWCEIKYQ